MEIHLLIHKSSLKIVDVLEGATSLIADRFHFHDRGRVQAGKKADMVLIAGDVREILADERNLCLSIREVWRDGETSEFLRDALTSQEPCISFWRMSLLDSNVLFNICNLLDVLNDHTHRIIRLHLCLYLLGSLLIHWISKNLPHRLMNHFRRRKIRMKVNPGT
jgi:hypothetical protein